MTRRTMLVLGAVPAVALLLYVVPLTLRQLAFFRVRQVELVGVQHHSPRAILDGMGLRDPQSVFESLRAMEKRVAEVPGVVAVEVRRRLPGTLRVRISERVPVALVSGPQGMVALDADARPLPYDPVESGVDLPLVARADAILTGALATVAAAAPDLFDDVDAAERHAGGGVVLRQGDRRIVLNQLPSVEAIESVGAVRRHLRAGGVEFEELDVQYEGMVIVRGSNG